MLPRSFVCFYYFEFSTCAECWRGLTLYAWSKFDPILPHTTDRFITLLLKRYTIPHWRGKNRRHAIKNVFLEGKARKGNAILKAWGIFGKLKWSLTCFKIHIWWLVHALLWGCNCTTYARWQRDPDIFELERLKACRNPDTRGGGSRNPHANSPQLHMILN